MLQVRRKMPHDNCAKMNLLCMVRVMEMKRGGSPWWIGEVKCRCVWAMDETRGQWDVAKPITKF